MKAEGHAQPFITEEARDEAIDAAIPLQTQKVRRHTRHIDDGIERNGAELFKPDAINRFAHFQIGVIMARLSGRKTLHFGAHGVGVSRIGEGRAVGEADFVKRIHRSKIDVVAHPATGQAPKLFKQERRRHDGWARIESEPSHPVNAGTTAGRVEAFNHRHIIAARAQTDRRRQPPEPRANNHRRGLSPRAAAGPCFCRRKHHLTL